MAVPIRAGDVVGEKYRIERQLGSGGMGVVLEATHLQLNQPVALKFLVDSGLEPEIAAERFLREARATFRLRSEHTVRVMDVGTLPTGEPFMVMEMLVGKDFKQLIADRGPLPVAEASLYMIQVCSALQEAHALGIIHRDLKSRNLYVVKRVDGTPCVKVLDFGISKMAQDSEAAPLTVPEMGMGSPRYMAPEQWTNASTVDLRADIYAAGAVFHELLTAQIPLMGMPLAEVIKRIRAGAVPSPKEIRPDLPDAICRVVMRALRPRPEERFPTAMHFAQAIREAQPEAEHAARPKAIMAMTVPTAVVNREVLLARAQIAAHLGNRGPNSNIPTPKERPDALLPETDPEAPSLASTLEDGGPSVSAPGDFDDNVATIVTRSPAEDDRGAYRDAANNHATLQVAEVPPEIQALRNKMYPPVPPPPAPPAPAPALQQPRTQDMAPHAVPPRFDLTYNDMAQQQHQASAPPVVRARARSAIPEPPKHRIPAWLFWMFLVISFCFAGGIVAALLTHFIK